MAGKLRHLRFDDSRWDRFCATLAPGQSPTALLEELMDAHLAKPPEQLPPNTARRLCQPAPPRNVLRTTAEERYRRYGELDG